jgi:hypothetical protein
MAGKGLLDRVRSWFGARIDSSDAGGPRAKRCTLQPLIADARTAFERSGAATVATGAAWPAEATDPLAEGDLAADISPAGAERVAASAAAHPAGPAHLDPLDPTWMQSLEELPRRIADSVTEAAGSARALGQIAGELSGHRQTSRVVMDAVRRLPALAANQVELTREAAKALDRQTLVLESLLDGVTALRSAFRTIEESSRRHVLAISQLETCHRQVLLEYQGMLIRAHRKLAWLAFGGVVLGAAALGGVAYAIVTVFAR